MRISPDQIEVMAENVGRLLIGGLEKVLAIASGKANPDRRVRRQMLAREDEAVDGPAAR
jgi:hypothetical protein